MSSSFDQNFRFAEDRLHRDQTAEAIECLRACLAERPDNSDAHALMAIALLDQKRRHAARHEANLALGSDPQNPTAHYADGVVAIAERRFKQAREAFDQQRQLEPENSLWVRASARLALLESRFDEVERLVARGLEIAPDNENFYVLLARLEIRKGNLSDAARTATDALRLAPESGEANMAMGDILFAESDHAGAREHALMALRADPQSGDALNLLAKVSRANNPLYWFWWKWASLFARMGDRLAILLLLCMFTLVQIATTALDQSGNSGGSTVLTVGWLLFAIYTWSAPAMIQRAIRKELETVKLSPDY